ncbi:PspC domain-containing protein [Nakamurella endophytica]|uniref:Phage shock protein PspC N-terminal domain-containing protein n=1 Tax=Nakamurella endophytica TaxID=1748367 RepID=A0A917WG93_9ACTN|nr:PspC domain-containing protein [Nakamurella endophytica]GGM02759.1 hypothetical protein GCM10011594_23570 [Nakamurella endophytica]
MTDSWPHSTATPTGFRPRRPHRSRADRKVAGVAGGLGRALGIDPVILRVAFVVLTVFGGFGGLLYVLGWLLLPDDGDEVSAFEALLGRGRSSVPPPLALGLSVVAAVSLTSMFWWGRFAWPAVIGTVIVIAVLRGRARGGCGGHGGERRAAQWQERAERHARDWDEKMQRHARRWSERAERWGDQATRWGDQAERWVATRNWGSGGRWGGGPDAGPRSPFSRPPFWAQPGTGASDPAGGTGSGSAGGRVDLSKDGRGPAGREETPLDGPHATVSAAPRPTRLPRDRAAATGATATDAATVGTAGADGANGRAAEAADLPRTPPSWDPLGVAPFAWDLPEPSPVVPPAPPRSVIPRITTSVALLAGALTSIGIFAGWWALSWAQVSAVMLAVVGLGLLLSALRGRGASLVGPGIFLSLITLALTVTGLRGTDGYGSTTWTVTDQAQLQGSYRMNAGNAVLDLSRLAVPAGETRSVVVELGAGHAEVVVPATAGATVTCEANAGRVDCLGQQEGGPQLRTTATQPGAATSGHLDVTVKVGGGYAEVRNG